METYLVLENIRSSENVGSIFRTADAVGISSIFLVGYTPTPIDRFGRRESKIAKAALGAEDSVSWKQFKDAREAVKELKKRGVQIISVEQTESAIDYKLLKVDKPTAFIFGNEVEGVSEEALKQSDKVVSIPMLGLKESLNVSVSTGVLLYRVLNI